MKYMTYAPQSNSIPTYRIADVLELSKYMLQELDVYMTAMDTYRFWQSVSDRFKVGWLDISFTLGECSRKDFISQLLKVYCIEISPRSNY